MGLNVQNDTTPHNHLEKTQTQPMNQVGKAGRIEGQQTDEGMIMFMIINTRLFLSDGL